MERHNLIEMIIPLEWEMFSAVSNIGGQADCQNQTQTFVIMRNSQLQTWSEELLGSYLDDLQTAKACNVNLMTLKYARMMQYTHPEEYAHIQDQLPPIDQGTRELIEEIVNVNIIWDRELRERYPLLRGRGRPATSGEDSPDVTSAETYMRGELGSYSPRSIAIYHQDTMQAVAEGINLAELNLSWTVRAYGYASIEDAERQLQQSVQH